MWKVFTLIDRDHPVTTPALDRECALDSADLRPTASSCVWIAEAASGTSVRVCEKTGRWTVDACVLVRAAVENESLDNDAVAQWMSTGHPAVHRALFREASRRGDLARLHNLLFLATLPADPQLLLEAIDNKHMMMMCLLLSRGAAVDRRAVALAAFKGDLRMCKALVEHGAPICASAHINATLSGNYDVMEYLLDHDIPTDPHVCENVAAQGDLVALLLYLDHGVQCPASVVEYAVESGRMSLIQHVLRTFPVHQSAILVAAASGRVNVLQLVCNHVQRPDSDVVANAVYQAIARGKPGVVDCLLRLYKVRPLLSPGFIAHHMGLSLNSKQLEILAVLMQQTY